MHGLSQNERYLYIYLDYIPGGELFNYLRSIGNLNNDEAKFYGA
jgi:serine/threonine protein kinase